jgi:hypothetical protein
MSRGGEGQERLERGGSKVVALLREAAGLNLQLGAALHGAALPLDAENRLSAQDS